MQTIIRFAPGSKDLRIEEDEWQIAVEDRMLRHSPTGAIFGIVFEGNAADEEKTSNHFAVLLSGAHCEGVQELGEAAIALYLIAVGALDYMRPEWEVRAEPKKPILQ